MFERFLTQPAVTVNDTSCAVENGAGGGAVEPYEIFAVGVRIRTVRALGRSRCPRRCGPYRREVTTAQLSPDHSGDRVGWADELSGNTDAPLAHFEHAVRLDASDVDWGPGIGRVHHERNALQVEVTPDGGALQWPASYP